MGPIRFFALVLSIQTAALNFDWERDQLVETEVLANSVFRSGNANAKVAEGCRFMPGDDEWPSDRDWAAFNSTLGGALLKPKPLGSVCYAGADYNAARCEQLRQGWTSSKLHADDAMSTNSQWASGFSCPPTSFPNSTCTQGGWPVYIVNATSTRHVQLAINFARNANLRLVIRNTGHDFNGKNIGGGALSIWTHNLKGITYLANYTSPTGSYTGRAVSYAAGTQASEGSALMLRQKVSMIVAGGPNVGIAGGYLQGGGHSGLLGALGFAADQVLAMTAVTADGKVVEMHEGLNEDLFWAFRGGGGGTFGVVTSVIVKVFDSVPLITSGIRFSTTSDANSNTSISTETFWKGMQVYWNHSLRICDVGGLGYNFVYPASSPTGLTFTVRISIPDVTTSEFRSILQPMLSELNDLGIETPMSLLKRSYTHAHTPDPYPESHPYSSCSSIRRRGVLGEVTGHTLLTSLLFPRASFSSSQSLQTTALAIRHAVESGNYTVHGMSETPARTHADNAVNPAFRKTVLHIQMYEPNAPWDGRAPILSRSDLTLQHERLQTEMQRWRDIVKAEGEQPGSYVNEGDAQDWGWQKGFWGDNYERLVEVKKEWDPQDVFWGVGMVGSEGWEIRGLDGGKREGIVVQDGRLCRVDTS